ncbi:MAG: HAD-IA family hydrolase [Anaerocolumna sp.]
MKFQNVWFDLGLTLVRIPVEEAYAQVLQAFEIEKSGSDIRRAFYLANKAFMKEYPHVLGTDSAHFMPWYLGVLNYHLGVRLNLQACAKLYSELNQQMNVKWQLIDGAVETLQKLKSLGIQTGLISNWNQTCRTVLSENGLDKLLNPIVISSEVGFEKPDSRIFVTAIKLANADPEKSLYVGDNYYDDVIGARKVGMKCLLISPYQRLGIEEIDHAPIITDVREVVHYIE